MKKACKVLLAIGFLSGFILTGAIVSDQKTTEDASTVQPLAITDPGGGQGH
ncbi:hypothetical protein HF072_00660 [Bacillus sp. RO3]|nr:hypothetical protein [Bacillus sp. RO3]